MYKILSLNDQKWNLIDWKIRPLTGKRALSYKGEKQKTITVYLQWNGIELLAMCASLWNGLKSNFLS